MDDMDDGNFLLKDGLDFRLEPYGDGQPAPKAPETASPFLLARSNLRDLEVVKARAKAVIAPALAYFSDKILVKRRLQLDRMRCAQIFDPLHAQAHVVTASDVEALKCFKFSKRADLALKIQAMKAEITKYNALVSQIKPQPQRMEQRRGGEAVDTWDIEAWWRGNRHELPAFAAVLRAVLTHSPNSCVPEAIFSILRDSFDSDQKSSFADYREYSLQKQYNDRFN